MKTKEPPCTEPYARWCERSANQLTVSLLLDFTKEEMCSRYADEWENTFVRSTEDCSFPMELRGGFCGFWGQDQEFTLFVDHVGNRGLYYYCKNGILIFSSNFYFIVELLKYHHIEMSISTQAIQYMLEQGFMLDDTTFAEEVKRVCPGCIVEIRDNQVVKRRRYYLIDNTSADKSTSTDGTGNVEVYVWIDAVFMRSM